MQGKRNDKKWTCNAVSDGAPDHVSMGSPLRVETTRARHAQRTLLIVLAFRGLMRRGCYRT